MRIQHDAGSRRRGSARGGIVPAIAGLAALALAAAVSACAGEGEPGEGEPREVEPAATGPRVFFTQPGDGATLTSPVRVTFGAEGVEIGAVPDEVETPRDGVVHFHLGIDADCLPPGTRIPSADPWIHFGDGSAEIETQLSPGEHRLTVQAGDDLHRTIQGLCETIEVTVEE